VVNHRAFKTDESFLEKIAIGAAGTNQVFTNLNEQGHHPIELERGSMSFKIWKQIKIKRVRVPDILCIHCARRVESRAKTSFEISMSHSLADPVRGWDYGLDDNDFVALVACKRVGERPIDWKADQLVQYISVKELRAVQANEEVKIVKPKGAEEGFEVRIKWPAVIAKAPGIISMITEDRIQYRRLDTTRTITLQKRPGLKPLATIGETVIANQILAAGMDVALGFLCSKSASAARYIALLSSLSLSERYGAAKALSFFESSDVFPALLRKIGEKDENIYVKLEAAAGLARHNYEEGWAFIQACLKDQYLENRLEAVIILGEIVDDVSCQLLIDVLSEQEQHAEIRAGTAWALGELHNKAALPALIESFVAIQENIRIEAARALAKLAVSYTPELVQRFPESATDKRPGIAWALSKSHQFTLEDLLGTLVDNDARHWVAYILGTQDQREYIHKIELLKHRDPEVYFAVTVLWKIMNSWVYNLETY
jgi:HEAT repeat protein